MSESDIDMDRAMQGIDDVDSHTQEITWTNCSVARPPYESIIVKDTRNNTIYHTHGESFLLCQREQGNKFSGRLREYEWTPYTQEKWKELNK